MFIEERAPNLGCGVLTNPELAGLVGVCHHMNRHVPFGQAFKVSIIDNSRVTKAESLIDLFETPSFLAGSFMNLYFSF